MFETQLAYHANAWDKEYLIQAMTALARMGYRGIEVDWEVAESFMYRVEVFGEMLHHETLELAAVDGKLWLVGPGSEVEEKTRFLSMGRFALACGCQVVVVIPPRRWPDAEVGKEEWQCLIRFANETGKELAAMGGVLAIHPDVDTWIESRSEINRLLNDTDPESVFLCVDTAHFAHTRINATNFCAGKGERVRHVHLKDYRRTKANYPYYRRVRAVGKGDFDFRSLVRKLDGGGYVGWIVGEYDAPSDADPEAAAKSAHDYAVGVLDLGL